MKRYIVCGNSSEVFQEKTLIDFNKAFSRILLVNKNQAATG